MQTTLFVLGGVLLAGLLGAWIAHDLRRRREVKVYLTYVQAIADGEEPQLTEDPPRLRNGPRVERLLSRRIRAARIDSVPAPVVLRYMVTHEGRAKQPRVVRSSGSDAFDRLALDVLPHARFEPARVYGMRIQVWVEQPFTFRPAAGARG